jgi:membrane protease YdiL (CAAX protease family)
VTDESQNAPPGRPLTALALMLVGPFLLGLLAAPHVFNLLQALAMSHPAWEGLADLRFERVVNRCVIAATILTLVPAFRLSGLWPSIRAALRRGPGRGRDLLIALPIAAVSLGAMYVAGWLAGAYSVEDPPEALKRAVVLIPGAVFIGVFEETFFRGFVFGCLRRRLPFWAAAIPAALFFASLHFFEPPKTRLDHAGPFAAFALLPDLFHGFAWAKHGPFAATLVLMGLTLSAIYERRGDLYLAIGLHGGWVVAIGVGHYWFDRAAGVLPGVFGRNDYVAQSPIAVATIALFLIAALRTRPRSRPAAAPPGSG